MIVDYAHGTLNTHYFLSNLSSHGYTFNVHASIIQRGMPKNWSNIDVSNKQTSMVINVDTPVWVKNKENSESYSNSLKIIK